MKFTVSALALCSLLSAQVSRVAVENDRVKVLSVDVQPHAKTKLHQHKINRVMIYLQPGKQDIAYQDGKKVELTWLAGEPKWSPLAACTLRKSRPTNPSRLSKSS